jgi:hypothetical protein
MKKTFFFKFHAFYTHSMLFPLPWSSIFAVKLFPLLTRSLVALFLTVSGSSGSLQAASLNLNEATAAKEVTLATRALG